MFLFSGLSAESKKRKQNLCALCGDYKLSNNNTIPYLRIHVLRNIQFLWSSFVLPFNIHSSFVLPFNIHSSFVLPFNQQSTINNLQSFWFSIVLSSIKHQVWSYARSARTLYIKITKGYILQHGMVLFLIVRLPC